MPATIRNPFPARPDTPSFLRTLGDLLGVYDPEQVVPTPAVTGFVKPRTLMEVMRGILAEPDVPAREAATKAAMTALDTTLKSTPLQPATREAVLRVAGRYPRVMAHQTSILANRAPYSHPTRYVEAAEDILGTSGTSKPIEAYLQGGTLPDKFSNTDIWQLDSHTPSSIIRTLFHELGHGAQRVAGGEKFNDYYDTVFNNLMRTFNNKKLVAALHPSEMGAEESGQNATRKVIRILKGDPTPFKRIKKTP